MQFCRRSVRLGSRRMLDASESLAFARYSHHRKNQTGGDGGGEGVSTIDPTVYWLQVEVGDNRFGCCRSDSNGAAFQGSNSRSDMYSWYIKLISEYYFYWMYDIYSRNEASCIYLEY